MIRILKEIIASLVPTRSLFLYLGFLPLIKKYKKVRVLNSRFEVHNDLLSIFNGKAVDYLEFGVYEGESINHWANLNKSPESRFFGFDTFEGLPESWQRGFSKVEKGEFNVEGQAPQINDSRVAFVKGLFQDSLPGFLLNFKPNKNLVIHFDADLYTSTLFVLTSIAPLLKGAYLIFDEFGSPLHEMRALNDFTEAFNIKVEPISRTREYSQVAFKVI